MEKEIIRALEVEILKTKQNAEKYKCLQDHFTAANLKNVINGLERALEIAKYISSK